MGGRKILKNCYRVLNRQWHFFKMSTWLDEASNRTENFRNLHRCINNIWHEARTRQHLTSNKGQINIRSIKFRSLFLGQ